MNHDEFAELSAGHALGALSPDDEKAYRDALAAHPEWEHIAGMDVETAASLADVVAPVAPPPELRGRLREMVGAPVEPVAPVEPAEETPDHAGETAPEPAEPAPNTDMIQTIERRNWSRGLFALAASIVLLVGIGWGAGALSHLWQTPPSVVALEEIQRAPDASIAAASFDGGSATLHWSESVGKVVLVADGLPAIDDDQTFELWYVRGDTPIPAGTFDASDGASTAELAGRMEPGDTIAVTVEQAGGSPSGVPTTTPIVAVPTA